MQILANGGTPSDALLRQAGLSGEDAAKMIAAPVEVAAGGGGGGGGGKTYYYDKYGYVYTTDKNGNATYVDKSTLSKNVKVYETNDSKGYDAYVSTAKKGTVEARANDKNVDAKNRFIH